MAEHPQSLPKADLRPHDARPVHEQGGTAPADAHVAPLLGPDAVREDPMFMLDEYLLALVDALGPPLPPRRRSRRRTSSASLTSAADGWHAAASRTVSLSLQLRVSE